MRNASIKTEDKKPPLMILHDLFSVPCEQLSTPWIETLALQGIMLFVSITE